jgi:hypothetical protein
MSDTETRLREAMRDTSTGWSGSGPTQFADRVQGARRYAVRARRLRLAATATTIAVVIGVGGAVATGAFHDRTLSPATPRPTTAPSLPPGPAWKDDVRLTGAGGTTITLSIRAVVTKTGSSAPDAQDRTKQLFTTPVLGGYYTLTNDTDSSHDINAPVQVLAYWQVPAGFCARYNSFIALGQWPVPKVAGGQELCPMAAADSTLPLTPQTLQPHRPLRVAFNSTAIGVAPTAPLGLNPADAATAVRVTSRPPVGWIAFDEDFGTGSNAQVTSTGMP